MWSVTSWTVSQGWFWQARLGHVLHVVRWCGEAGRFRWAPFLHTWVGLGAAGEVRWRFDRRGALW